jgi:hypothetical protein
MTHWLIVRDRPGFLHRMMVELAGNAQLSLEGNLSRCQFTDDLVITRDETSILKRNTTAPKQDFVVLRLAPETVEPILKQALAAGLKRVQGIIHVQIERDGVLELGAYDNFDDECVATGPGVKPTLLEELRKNNVLRDFRIATPQPR